MKRTSTLSSCFMYGIFGLLFRVHDISKNNLVCLRAKIGRRFEVDIWGVGVLNGVQKSVTRRLHTCHNIVLARYPSANLESYKVC